MNAGALGRIILQQIGPHYADVANPGVLIRAMNYINSINSQVIWFWIMSISRAATPTTAGFPN